MVQSHIPRWWPTDTLRLLGLSVILSLGTRLWRNIYQQINISNSQRRTKPLSGLPALSLCSSRKRWLVGPGLLFSTEKASSREWLMEPTPAISTCMRASLNWRVRCTHASLPPFHHSTRRVPRVFPNDHASPSRIEKPFLHQALHPRQSSFPANHVPIRFSCCRPTLALHLGLDFAWLVRWESDGALDWRERTRSRTVRTFHHGDATVRKSFEIDGNHHSRKRAFG